MSEKKSLKQRRKELMAEYGWTFVGINFTIFVIEMAILLVLLELLQVSPASIADSLGIEVEISESSGNLVIAYLITRAFKIPQLILVSVITPSVARRIRRWKAARKERTTPETHRLDSIAVSEGGGDIQD